MSDERAPSIRQLDAENVLHISTARIIWVLIAPPLSLAVFVALVCCDTWPTYILAIVTGYFAFRDAFSNTHNLVHGTFRGRISKTRWLSDVLISVYGLMWFYSGHAYRVGHMKHHEFRCGDSRDPEGVSNMSGWKALLLGPRWSLRVWWFGLRNAKRRRDRLFILAELTALVALTSLAGCCIYQCVSGEISLPVTSILVYVGLQMFLFWVFPFFSSWVPHWRCRPTLRRQAVNLTGWIWWLLFSGDRIHLLHHLFPSVHSSRLPDMHNLPKVAAWLATVPDDHDDAHGDHD